MCSMICILLSCARPLCLQILHGRKSLPLYRLPVMISAQRHFSYNNAMLELSVSHLEGKPGAGNTKHSASF